MDAGNIMKPALARGTIKCIGATTTAEYRKSIEKDPALERRFQVIWVDEPTKEEAILMLRGIRKKLEEHHGVVINDDVIAKAVELSMRYINDFRLPDKAIDILDQACARMMLKTFTPEIVFATENATLTVDDIVRVVAERCKIPVGTLTIEEQERFLSIDDALKQRVIGQDHAIREVGKAIRSAKAGLNDPNKPIVFLFAGSTGTGKTELAKALAEFLFHDANRLISFDMSEYQEKHSVAKLIGSPPGYVGYEEDGQLTGKIRSNPYSVLLFDEIEKAHPSIFDIFLQIFDEGRLTDGHGRRVNFSESVIILTTNLGSNIGQQQSRDRNPFGFQREPASSALTPSNRDGISDTLKEYELHIRKAIESAFRPEFLNRVQKQITFYPLAPETVRQIITLKILPALNNRLIPRGIQVLLSEDAVTYLMNIGYKEAFGAREMQRVFDQNISEQISHMILKGEVSAGLIVRVTAKSQGLQLMVD
jgi:ATP-dependent Clp protease ATP-binding subunit ClpC